jgi:hypothetical protein
MKLYLRRADWTGKRGNRPPLPSREFTAQRMPSWADSCRRYLGGGFFRISVCRIDVVECRWVRDMTICQGKRRRKGGREKGRERKQRGEKRGKRKVIVQYGR